MRNIVLLLSLFLASMAQAQCRHALVLALDISGSVNEREYRLQLDGLAMALSDPQVQDLILANPTAPISIAVFEWSSERHQQLIVNWQDILTAQMLDVIAARLRMHNKDRITLKTAIGEAMQFSAALMRQKPDCWRKTIDISGDGTNNDGRVPESIRKFKPFRDITINALIVTQAEDETGVYSPADEARMRELTQYYTKNVIHGAAAFTMQARGYEDYARAMKAKLIKELSPAMIGFFGPTGAKNRQF